MTKEKFSNLLYEKFPNAKMLEKTTTLPEILKMYAILLFVSDDTKSELAKEIRKQLSNLYTYGTVKFEE
jgi:hypothetical protein